MEINGKSKYHAIVKSKRKFLVKRVGINLLTLKTIKRIIPNLIENKIIGNKNGKTKLKQ